MRASWTALASVLGCGVILAAGTTFAWSGNESGENHLIPLHDRAFEQAAADARRSLPVFLAKWRARPSGYSEFGVKADFRRDDGKGVESLWLEPERVASNGKIVGHLGNDAALISRLKIGALVEVEPAAIVDWMYLKDGKMYGQFTMRAQLGRATPQQRAQFEARLAQTPLEPSQP